MNNSPQYPHSHLFTVRIWSEELGSGKAEWRGRVEDARSGETRYFRDWAALIDFLQGNLPDRGDDRLPKP
ncbi:MAG TPA: hypothetical protein VER55_08435 [Ardenticatenaceae bacterium]|nr:hypothetical protein [Ardenticatenaceae bacterium]